MTLTSSEFQQFYTAIQSTLHSELQTMCCIRLASVPCHCFIIFSKLCGFPWINVPCISNNSNYQLHLTLEQITLYNDALSSNSRLGITPSLIHLWACTWKQCACPQTCVSLSAICARVHACSHFLNSAMLHNRSQPIPHLSASKFAGPLLAFPVPPPPHAHTHTHEHISVMHAVNNPNGKSSISLLVSRTWGSHEKDAG